MPDLYYSHNATPILFHIPEKTHADLEASKTPVSITYSLTTSIPTIFTASLTQNACDQHETAARPFAIPQVKTFFNFIELLAISISFIHLAITFRIPE